MSQDDWNGRRVLVTGAAGFIGSNLVERLLSMGANVIAIDAMLAHTGANRFHVVPHRQSTFVRAAVQDVPDLERQLDGVDVIYHLAASNAHAMSMTEPVMDFRANQEPTLGLLLAARDAGFEGCFVYTSTRQLYGGTAGKGVDESHPPDPPDINAIHNWSSERYLELIGGHHGIHFSILRLANCYGPRQLIAHHRLGVAGWFINRALCGETLDLFDGGYQRRNFTYVDDVVDLLLRVPDEPKALGEVFNVSGFDHSLREFAHLAIDTAGTGTVNVVDTPPEQRKIDIGNCVVSGKKLEVTLGWTPSTPLARGIERTIRYFREHKDRYLAEDRT